MLSAPAQVALLSPAPRYFEPLRERRDPLSRLRRLPRLGLLALEAVTPPDWQLRIIDERVEAINVSEIEAPLIGITAMTYLAPRAFELARLCKLHGKTVVMGGYFASLSPELALAEPSVDAVVIGRGEKAWPQLLNDFRSGCLRRRYQEPFDQDDFTLPRVNHRLTGPEHGYNEWITQVQATLGCKFSCRFCVIPDFHQNKMTLRNLDDVTETVARAPTRRVLFVDDNLLNRPAYLDALCDRLRPLGKEWIAQVSLDIGKQPRLLAKMAKAGCGWLNVGIESIHADTLAAQEKWQNDVPRYLETLDRIRQLGINLSAGLVLGFPQEPRYVFESTGELLDRAALDIAIFHLYTPYPGSRDHAQLAAQGRILTHDLELYDTYHVVVRPDHFAPEEVARGLEQLEERFYRPHKIAARALNSLTQMGPPGLVRTVATGVEGWFNLRQGLPLHP